MFSIQNNFCKKGGGGGGNCGHRRVTWHESEVSTVASNFFFPFLPTGVLYGMKVKCNLMRQIYKRHLALRIFFSVMQEITLYFLRQNKLGFILT